MMGPFYHRVFPYKKFIMLDADLKFQIGKLGKYQSQSKVVKVTLFYTIFAIVVQIFKKLFTFLHIVSTWRFLFGTGTINVPSRGQNSNFLICIFYIDISELFDHFDNFNEDQIMGVAVDLAPHYRVAFRKYREQNPDTKVGEPGRFQVSLCTMISR